MKTVLATVAILALLGSAFYLGYQQRQEEIARLQGIVVEQSATISTLRAERNAETASAQALLSFADKALGLQQAMTTIRDEGLSLRNTILTGSPLSLCDFDTLTTSLLIVRNSLENLNAPPDAAQIKDSLLQESSLTLDYVAALRHAWQAVASSSGDNCVQRCHQLIELAEQTLDNEICPLQNMAMLMNLELQAERDLG